jgi:hypothetical protein
MADFGFFEQRSRATVAKRLEVNRNPIRARGMQNIQRAVLGFLIRKCHELHRAAGVACGPVCMRFPHVLPEELPAGVAKAHLKGVMAAMAGKHDMAIKSFRRALKQAGKVSKAKEYQVTFLSRD